MFAATVMAVPAPVIPVVRAAPASPAVAPVVQATPPGFAAITEAERVVEVIAPVRREPAAQAPAPKLVSELSSNVFGAGQKTNRASVQAVPSGKKRESVAQPQPQAQPQSPPRRATPEVQAARAGRASVTNTPVTAARSNDVFDLAGLIAGFQAALLVVGITLMVPFLTDAGLASGRVALGTNLPYVAYAVAAALAAAAVRVGMVGASCSSMALHAAGAGLLVLAVAVFVSGAALQDPLSSAAAWQRHVPLVAPWAVIFVCLGLAGFGLRRAREELWSDGRPRTVYGTFVLVMALGGVLAGYKIVRYVALPASSNVVPQAEPAPASDTPASDT
jgi:hypothetical protein